MSDDVTPIRRGMHNSTELQLGREIAKEVPAMVREMQCMPCGIGVAIARVEKRNGISPVFDWAGAAAKKAGHACSLTTWDKREAAQLALGREFRATDRGSGQEDQTRSQRDSGAFGEV